MNWVEEIEWGSESKSMREREQLSKQDKKVAIWLIKSLESLTNLCV